MRRSILAIATILMLTPACKEEGGKQYWQGKEPKLSKTDETKRSKEGREIVKVYNAVITSNKKSLKLLKKSKTKLQTNGQSLLSERIINEAVKLQSDAIHNVANGFKDLNRIDKLLVAARKSRSLTEADMQLMAERSATLKALTKAIFALNKKLIKAAKKAQMAINEHLKKRLRKLRKQTSK